MFVQLAINSDTFDVSYESNFLLHASWIDVFYGTNKSEIRLDMSIEYVSG